MIFVLFKYSILFQTDEYDDNADNDDNWKPPKKRRRAKNMDNKDLKSAKYEKPKAKSGKKKPKNKEAELFKEDNGKVGTNDEALEADEPNKSVELLLARSGCKYLVKWKDLPYSENTWEHWTTIPDNILNVGILYFVLIVLNFFVIVSVLPEGLIKAGIFTLYY